jgi:hypothetical protein
MLVDQGRSVGGDPMGYKCSGEASWCSPDGYLLCEVCREMLLKEAWRLTIPRKRPEIEIARELAHWVGHQLGGREAKG